MSAELVGRINGALRDVMIQHLDVEKILATRHVWDELVRYAFKVQPDGAEVPTQPAEGDTLFGLPLIVSKDVPADPGFVIVQTPARSDGLT